MANEPGRGHASFTRRATVVACGGYSAFVVWSAATTAAAPASTAAAWRYGAGVPALGVTGLFLAFACRHALPAWSVRLLLLLYALLLFLSGLDVAGASLQRRLAAKTLSDDWRYRNRVESARTFQSLGRLTTPSGTPMEHVGPFAPNQRGQLLRSPVTTNEWGYRREIGPPPQCSEKPDPITCRERRVLCVGGSTTWGVTQEADDLPYPDVLEIMLATQLPHQAVQVINGGLVAGKVVDARRIAERQAQFGAPVDVVVLYAGLNTIPDSIKGRAWPRASLLATAADRAWVARRGARAVSRYDGVAFAAALQTFLETVRTHGAVPVLATTALPFAADDEPTTLAYWDRLVTWHSSARTLARMIEIHNAQMRAVARMQEVSLVDAGRDLAGRPELFIDEEHFTQEGRRELAGLIAQAVIAALEQAGHVSPDAALENPPR